MPAASQVQMFSQVLMSVEDAAAGLGIALATDFMVQGDLSSGSLIALDWPDLHTCFQFNLCCKQRKWKSRTLRSLSFGCLPIPVDVSGLLVYILNYVV
ncbi:MAG: LysR substrate-binding domain-containing protein, partial [Shewanella sp.]|nr:LysR substrate-binding domain-containing protein [Shewanella sp.]